MNQISEDWASDSFMCGQWNRRELEMLKEMVSVEHVRIHQNIDKSLRHLDWLEQYRLSHQSDASPL